MVLVEETGQAPEAMWLATQACLWEYIVVECNSQDTYTQWIIIRNTTPNKGVKIPENLKDPQTKLVSSYNLAATLGAKTAPGNVRAREGKRKTCMAC